MNREAREFIEVFDRHISRDNTQYWVLATPYSYNEAVSSRSGKLPKALGMRKVPDIVYGDKAYARTLRFFGKIDEDRPVILFAPYLNSYHNPATLVSHGMVESSAHAVFAIDVDPIVEETHSYDEQKSRNNLVFYDRLPLKTWKAKEPLSGRALRSYLRSVWTLQGMRLHNALRKADMHGYIGAMAARLDYRNLMDVICRDTPFEGSYDACWLNANPLDPRDVLFADTSLIFDIDEKADEGVKGAVEMLRHLNSYVEIWGAAVKEAFEHGYDMEIGESDLSNSVTIERKIGWLRDEFNMESAAEAVCAGVPVEDILA